MKALVAHTYVGGGKCREVGLAKTSGITSGDNTTIICRRKANSFPSTHLSASLIILYHF